MKKTSPPRYWATEHTEQALSGQKSGLIRSEIKTSVAISGAIAADQLAMLTTRFSTARCSRARRRGIAGLAGIGRARRQKRFERCLIAETDPGVAQLAVLGLQGRILQLFRLRLAPRGLTPRISGFLDHEVLPVLPYASTKRRSRRRVPHTDEPALKPCALKRCVAGRSARRRRAAPELAQPNVRQIEPTLCQRDQIRALGFVGTCPCRVETFGGGLPVSGLTVVHGNAISRTADI